jgi:hypothetical protein
VDLLTSVEWLRRLFPRACAALTVVCIFAFPHFTERAVIAAVHQRANQITRQLKRALQPMVRGDGRQAGRRPSAPLDHFERRLYGD